MILAEHFPQNGPLQFQANNIPVFAELLFRLLCGSAQVCELLSYLKFTVCRSDVRI